MAKLRTQRGFTLVELMVVVFIIGLLMAVAVVSIGGSTYAGTPLGFAEKISSEIESSRLRATSSRRWQRLRVFDDEVQHLEAIEPGMTKPDDDADWRVVRSVFAPGDVEVAAVAEDKTHLEPGDGVPAAGVGLGADIDFAPDGSGARATIFIRDGSDKQRLRVIIYRATGTAYIYEGW